MDFNNKEMQSLEHKEDFGDPKTFPLFTEEKTKAPRQRRDAHGQGPENSALPCPFLHRGV